MADQPFPGRSIVMLAPNCRGLPLRKPIASMSSTIARNGRFDWTDEDSAMVIGRLHGLLEPYVAGDLVLTFTTRPPGGHPSVPRSIPVVRSAIPR